jgi:antitoxin component YwqK of YwqJK toxin-antitoxin module
MNQPYLAWADRDAVDDRVMSVSQTVLGYDDCSACYLHQGQPFTGYSAIRYPDGHLRSLTGFTNGIEHGLTVGWYPNGHIRIYAETAEAVYHGLVAEWGIGEEAPRVTYFDRGLEVKPPGS